jgi:formate-dependent nitrite reductase membrane component NrfD
MNISEMTWGIKLWFDLWVVGMASGAFLVAFIINRLSGGKQANLFRTAVCTGLILALIGVLLLLSHLGHILWFWHLFVAFRPVSVLSMGGWILTGWLTVAGIMVVLWIAENYLKKAKSAIQKITGALSWLGMVLSVLLISYGGVLIATTNQPLWASTLLLPAVFVGSALCTGAAWLVLCSLLANGITGGKGAFMNWFLRQFFGAADWKIDVAVINRLAKVLLAFLVAELVIVAAFVAWGWSAAPDSFKVMVTGEMAVYFWVGMVVIGLAAPLALLLFTGSKSVANRMAGSVVAASSLLAVLGGLILRAVILISAQL